MPLNLTPPAINPNAEKVLSKRYYRKDENGQCVEDATGLFWRVASSVAAEEAKYEQSPWKPDALARAFYDMMTDWRFLPNSPTLMNAGSELGQLSACFVLPVGDSIEEIFDAVKFAAMIHKSGGGTGFSFSRLRPKNSRVGTTGGVASGPVSFLRIFNTATEQIKQGGTRRGANMGILRIDHPDILEFIRAKEQEGEFNNFNLPPHYRSLHAGRGTGSTTPSSTPPAARAGAQRPKVQPAADKACKAAIIIFRRHAQPPPAQGDQHQLCGEQPLLPHETNLGSLNLSSFFVPGHLDETNPADRGIDWAGLERTIALAVRFLDNVVDASQFPLERIAEQVRRNRKIGLGVMGWADLLYQLRIPYDSADAITLAERIMDFIE
ncbi:MAG: ribonucleotide reductase N-terminal alpha domain-containing protein, partial [Bilophila wadsworthia]